ncbi:MAG: indolepyruvate ferredoxin oxidoreductase subunit alpha [Deltaproteobacteria bacterium]|nr:indolepyruvate ferredoxin oxidoreductase subunit alpha [Deltaproteobacteria bacterium]
MAHALLSTEPGRRLLLLGNEAIVRGALEAGVGFVSTYPGTPSSEIGDTFSDLAAEAGVVFEYSANEKVALEVAAAAASAGVRALVAMKHVGVNVAADPLLTLAYIGVRGGLVLVSADDPGCHSSQNEQDNRYFARMASLPMLEPATPAEAYAMTRLAFELSERVELPVILRTTTRVSHTRAPIAIGERMKAIARGEFIRDPARFVMVPANARRRHPVLLRQLAKADAELANSPLHLEYGYGRELGIVTTGVAACYVHDIVRGCDLESRVSVLKVATTHPLPRARCAEFLRRFETVLVAEELEPILENDLKAIACDERLSIRVLGKGSAHFSRLGEFDPDGVRDAIRAALGDMPIDAKPLPDVAIPPAPPRPPILCAACPHRSTYLLVRTAMGEGAVYMTDIGCYTLGFAPPLSMGDFCLCMGSSITKASGLSSVSDQPVVAFIGDSTFFHSGVAGLVNAVHNRRSFLLVVMDNGTTGMTGHQPHPGAQTDAVGSRDVMMDDLIRAAGVDHLCVIDPGDFGASLRAIEEIKSKEGLRVVIARSPCPLYARKELGIARPATKYEVDADLCRACGREGCGLACGMPASPESERARATRRITSEADTLVGVLAEPSPKMEQAPCQETCPAGICVQGYVNRIAAGEDDKAMELIRQRVALPGMLGRICERPCEVPCVYGDHGDRIEINRLKRYVSDRETREQRALYASSLLAKIVPTGHAVAVVGSGPAGLSCAFDLRVRGYDVTVFEAESVLGGIPGWAVPEFRLPRVVIDRDLEVFHLLGVEFRTGVRIGIDVTLGELKSDGYDAIFLGVGARFGARLGIDGEDLAGVEDGLAFLRRARLGENLAVGRRVAVIGGGNSAIDAARTAVRLGAQSVSVIYRRGRDELPADTHEVAEAVEEGVEFRFQLAPMSARGTGRVERLTCAKTKLGEPDSSGRRRAVVMHGQNVDVETDHVIVAVGQRLDGQVSDLVGVDRRGWIAVESENGATSVTGVFAGGDAVSGPRNVVEAIAAGKRAAWGIDRYLTNGARPVLPEPVRPLPSAEAPRYRPRGLRPERAAEVRRAPLRGETAFDEREQTYTVTEARVEARRCLACGLCASCRNCLDNFGCPAFYEKDGRAAIDPALCDGCGVCVQVCPNGAIHARQAFA